MTLKSFSLWLEEMDDNHKLRSMLLKRLGFDPKADDAINIKIRDLDKSRLKDSIGSMGLDDDTVMELQMWIDQHPDSNLSNLLSQMRDDEMDNLTTDLPSKPAVLPKGTQPMPKPMQMPQQNIQF